ncbi:HTH-type transcriptional regulator SgrR, partial [Frankliniella fusca]
MPPGRAWKCCKKKCQERDSNPRFADLKSAALDHSAILTSLDTSCTEGLLSQDNDLGWGPRRVGVTPGWGDSGRG